MRRTDVVANKDFRFYVEQTDAMRRQDVVANKDLGFYVEQTDATRRNDVAARKDVVANYYYYYYPPPTAAADSVSQARTCMHACTDARIHAKMHTDM